jgi:hypothetical protein
VVFLPVAAALVTLLLLGGRVVTRRWGPSPWLLWSGAIGAWALVAVFLWTRASQPALVPFFVLAPAALTTVTALVGRAAGGFVRREVPRSWPPWLQGTTGAGVGVLTAVLVGLLASPLPIPVPRGGAAGNAAASLVATAGDLARFGVELGSPTLLDPSLAAEMHRPQVTVSDSVAWGLGVGIAQGNSGFVLYHWGSNPSVRALLLVHPVERWVIAVLANREASRAGVARIVKAATGAEGPWLSN